jgi:hypothetical protein
MSLLFIWRSLYAKAVVTHLSTLILAIFVDKRIVSLWLLDLTEDVGHERHCKSRFHYMARWKPHAILLPHQMAHRACNPASQHSYSPLIA